jgi:hypothetical protein
VGAAVRDYVRRRRDIRVAAAQWALVFDEVAAAKRAA